jgi:hypothetical protein
VDTGPTTLTSEDHYATEVSEELLTSTDDFVPQKAWEKDAPVDDGPSFEARDVREGKQTVKQEGLSSFAVEVTEDMLEGDSGLKAAPVEEETTTKRFDTHQADLDETELENLTKKPSGKAANPFALELSDDLTGELDKFEEPEDPAVPDSGAKSFEASEYEEPGNTDAESTLATESEVRDLGVVMGADPMPGSARAEDAEGTITKEAEISAEQLAKLDHGSLEDMPTTGTGDPTIHGGTSYELMRQALEAAVEEEVSVETDGDMTQVAEAKEEEPGGAVPAHDANTGSPEFGLDQDQYLTESTSEAMAREIDNLAVMVGDPPPGAQPANLYVAEEHTTPGADAEMAEEERATLPPPPPPPPPEDEGFDDTVLATSPGRKKPEEPSQPAVAIEVELEEGPALELEADKAAEPGPGEDLAADKFWTEPGGKYEPEAPTIRDQDELQPRPESSAPVTMPPDPDAPSAKKTEITSDDAEFINTLFEKSDGSPEDDGMVPVPAPPSQEALKEALPRPMQVGKRAAPTGGGASNDLRGPRKATVHTKDGVTRRGIIGHIDTDADTVRLDPPAGSSAPAEDLVALSLKAIFLMLPRGTGHPPRSGDEVRLVLIDGRSLEGTTPDYNPSRKAFTLFPSGSRGNVERIIVFNDAVKNIWFDEA